MLYVLEEYIMANDYHDILIEHIEALMRERNISQADIIRGTGILSHK